MAIKCIQTNKNRGVAILIAVIFMSVMLALGLALSSLAYKQYVIASGATQSHYAFYAADAALECTLYADQKLNLFSYDFYVPSATKTMTCDTDESEIKITQTLQSTHLKSTARISLDNGSRCADISVYKPIASGGNSFIFSQGYDVSCSKLSDINARITSRGLSARY